MTQAVKQPIPSATLILLRDSHDDDGIETLIMRRSSKMDFLGGFWVFPGGGVEEQDAAVDEIQTALNAAVRETFEEAGVKANPENLLPVSKWVAPEVAPKRFSTWVFISEADGQIAEADGSEMTDSLWVKPGRAIEKHRFHEIDLLPPTLISLMGLSGFSSVSDVLAHYQNKSPLEFLPRASYLDEQLVMLYQGDAGYDKPDAENTTNTTVRHRCMQITVEWSPNWRPGITSARPFH